MEGWMEGKKKGRKEGQKEGRKEGMVGRMEKEGEEGAEGKKGRREQRGKGGGQFHNVSVSYQLNVHSRYNSSLTTSSVQEVKAVISFLQGMSLKPWNFQHTMTAVISPRHGGSVGEKN